MPAEPAANVPVPAVAPTASEALPSFTARMSAVSVWLAAISTIAGVSAFWTRPATAVASAASVSAPPDPAEVMPTIAVASFGTTSPRAAMDVVVG